MSAGVVPIERGRGVDELPDEVPREFPVVLLLDGQAPSPPEMLVDELLLDRDVNLWAGAGGSGKTAMALAVSVAVVVGRPVFGSLCVRRNGPVLIVAPEDGHGAVRMMVDAIVAGLRLTEVESELLLNGLVMVADDSIVRLALDAPKLANTARAFGAVLVVLDPLRDLLGGENVNDTPVSQSAYRALRQHVCRDAGAAVLLSHHNRKPARDDATAGAASRHDSLGSTGWVDGARLVFAVGKKGNDVTFVCTKANRVRADLRHELRLEIEADATNAAHWRSCKIANRNAGATSEALTPGIGRALNENERTVLGVLDDTHEPGLRLSWSRWRDDSGMKNNANTFKSITRRLLDARLVAAIATGHKNRNGSVAHAYAMTDEGRRAMQSGWTFDRAKGEGVTNGD